MIFNEISKTFKTSLFDHLQEYIGISEGFRTRYQDLLFH